MEQPERTIRLTHQDCGPIDVGFLQRVQIGFTFLPAIGAVGVRNHVDLGHGTDATLLHDLRRRPNLGIAAPLGADLDDAFRFHHSREGYIRIGEHVAHRFFAVDVLARFHNPLEHAGVLMISSGNDDGFDVFVLEDLLNSMVDFRLRPERIFHAFGGSVAAEIPNIADVALIVEVHYLR